jgi:ABC-2 type transport system permease protein
MTPRAWLRVVKNSFVAELEYRANYVTLAFSTVISVIMEMAVFSQIYANRETVGTLPRTHALAFVLLGALVRPSLQLWSLVGECVDEIRDGSFRKFLLQPISYTRYFFARVVGPKLTTWLMVLGTLMIAPFLNENLRGSLKIENAPYFLISFVIACVTMCFLYLTIIYLAFWIEEATFLSTALNVGFGFLSGSLVPLSWFPAPWNDWLRYLPFALLGDFTMRAGLGLLGPGEFVFYLMSGLCWIFGLWLLGQFLWKRGLRNYESFGG